MAQGLRWDQDSAQWPHRERSRFVDAAGIHWHVQHWPAPTPAAKQLLLLHGTGASTHSWAGLAPLLAQHFGLLSLDLPGHGFSSAARAGSDGASLPGMARGVRALLAAANFTPQYVLGHSAGTALALRMVLDGLRLNSVIGINAALLPLPGLAGSFFSPAAKLLALNPLVPHLFSWHAQSRGALQRLIASTGSRLDETGTALYRQLVTNPGHVAGALAMMARWDLPGLARELPQLQTPLHLIVGAQDITVPPADAQRVLALVKACAVTTLPGLGHLAHEENPGAVAEVVVRVMTD